MQSTMQGRRSALRSAFASAHASAIAISLLLVGVITLGLLGLAQLVPLDHVTVIYLIPVMVAATRWGVVPAVLAAVAGVAVSSFFFYPPIYDLRVAKAEHI